jgi:hypothetical protein
VFDFIDIFAINDITTRLRRNEMSCLVLKQGNILITHGLLPLGNRESLLEVVGLA